MNVKLKLWDSGHVLMSGPKAKSLLTTVFTPSSCLIPTNSEIWPTCAAASASPHLSEKRVIQVNRCLIELVLVMLIEGLVRCCRCIGGSWVRYAGRSPRSTGCWNAETRAIACVNARSVLRPSETGSKTLIGQIEERPLYGSVSAEAMRTVLRLSEVSSNVFLAAPWVEWMISEVSPWKPATKVS